MPSLAQAMLGRLCPTRALIASPLASLHLHPFASPLAFARLLRRAKVASCLPCICLCPWLSLLVHLKPSIACAWLSLLVAFASLASLALGWSRLRMVGLACARPTKTYQDLPRPKPMGASICFSFRKCKRGKCCKAATQSKGYAHPIASLAYAQPFAVHLANATGA
jgi:hypothetical protein